MLGVKVRVSNSKDNYKIAREYWEIVKKGSCCWRISKTQLRCKNYKELAKRIWNREVILQEREGGGWRLVPNGSIYTLCKWID